MFKATFESKEHGGETFIVIVSELSERAGGGYRIFIDGGVMPDGRDEWTETRRAQALDIAATLVEDLENS